MPNKKKVKVLTLEDLYNFYFTKNKSLSFSSDKSGYQIIVHVFSDLNFSETDVDKSLLVIPAKMYHIGKNANGSNVTEDAAKKAMKSMAYKPVLANFMEYTDSATGEIIKDFTAHDMELVTKIDNDGNEYKDIHYIEKQVGCITADEPYIEYDESFDRDFIFGKVAIPRDYTDAAEIIEKKGGTKVSVELAINECQFNAREKTLVLSDIEVMGLTLLGTNPDTLKEYQCGMTGSELRLKDFSEENNSLFSSITEKEKNELAKTLQRINATLESINETKYFRKEDEKLENVKEFDETKKADSIDESIVESTSEATVDTQEVVEPSEVEPEENTTDTEVSSESHEDENVDVDDSNDNDESEEFNKKFVKSYELSFDDIRYCIYQLLATYEELDNTYYWISDVFDSYFIYEGSGKIYRQDYVKDGDLISFSGERIELYKELLTASEKAELDSMRQDYSLVKTELNVYKEKENHEARASILNDEAYLQYAETDEFKALVADMDNYTIEELRTKCELAYAKCVRGEKNTFSVNKPKTMSFAFGTSENKTSFLDGLLNKKK